MTKWFVGLVCVGVALGLWAFEPWRLLTSSEIDEAVPTADVLVATSERPVAATPSSVPTPRDQVLSRGGFVPAEHATGGRAQVLRLADGRRFLRLESLATSDGPDLHVWLSDQPSGGDWGSYDDGRYVRLGELKATHGNQNYLVPDGVALADLTTVVIWCDRFNVAFGTAALSPAG